MVPWVHYYDSTTIPTRSRRTQTCETPPFILTSHWRSSTIMSQNPKTLFRLIRQQVVDWCEDGTRLAEMENRTLGTRKLRFGTRTTIAQGAFPREMERTPQDDLYICFFNSLSVISASSRRLSGKLLRRESCGCKACQEYKIWILRLDFLLADVRVCLFWHLMPPHLACLKPPDASVLCSGKLFSHSSLTWSDKVTFQEGKGKPAVEDKKDSLFKFYCLITKPSRLTPIN